MNQTKWVIIMAIIVIVVLGILIVLLLYDGGYIPETSPTPVPAAASPVATAEATQAPEATQTPEATPAPEATQVPEQPQPALTPTAAVYLFPVYDDALEHYGDIAYMGNNNNGDDGSMTIDPGCAENPYSGSACLKITYTPPSLSHWAGMMWISGANNYPPNLPVDGVDAAQANRLTFYARGDGSTKFFIENDERQQVTLNVQLTPDWTQYTLDVPSDWQQVCVGFGFASNGSAGDFTLYLDDIVFSN